MQHFQTTVLFPKSGGGVLVNRVWTNSRPHHLLSLYSSRQYPPAYAVPFIISREEEEEERIKSVKWATLSIITIIVHYYSNGERDTKIKKGKKRYPFISVYFIKIHFRMFNNRIINRSSSSRSALKDFWKSPQLYSNMHHHIMRGWISKRLQWKLMSDVIILLNPLVPVRSPTHSIFR